MNVTKLRADTPGCASLVHLDNAGASLMPGPVLRAITAHLDLEASIGGCEAESEASVQIAAAYEDVAKLLGTSASNIVFSGHATASFVAALSAVRFSAGDVLLTTRNDYVSNQIQHPHPGDWPSRYRRPRAGPDLRTGGACFGHCPEGVTWRVPHLPASVVVKVLETVSGAEREPRDRVDVEAHLEATRTAVAKIVEVQGAIRIGHGLDEAGHPRRRA